MGEEHRIEQLLQEILQRLTKIETFNSTNHDRIRDLEEEQKQLIKRVVELEKAPADGVFKAIKSLVYLIAGAVIMYFINKG